MNSSLPNFSAAPAAAPATANLVLPGFECLATGVGTPGAAPAADFATLMGATITTTGGTPTVSPETTTIGAPSILSLCVVSGAALETPAAPTEVSPEQRDEAMAFACSLLQTLLPEIFTAPAAPAPVQSGPATSLPTALASQSAAIASPAAKPEVGGVVPFVAADAATQSQVATAAKPEVAAEVTTAAAGAASQPAGVATVLDTLSIPVEEFQFSIGADGAIEVSLALPENDAAEGTTYTADSANSGTPMEIHAELELPGQAVMRFDATVAVPSTATPAESMKANFAAAISGPTKGVGKQNDANERKFESVDGKKFKKDSKEAGIDVAKSGFAMTSAPIQENSTVRDTAQVPALAVDFSKANPVLDRAAAPAPTAAEQNFAARAVSTVTNLVEAQFSASMQKAGSVQFRMKLGGEDLSIRVELRGGEVRTDFQTDSAELRAAISREWQTVAAHSPEQMRRYVEPVFSPSGSNSSHDGQQSFGRQAQSSLQQDFSQQRSPRQQQEEAAPFARGSLLRDTFFPETVAPRAPAFAPNSLRLSVLA